MHPIGIFDSGYGGLTIMKEIEKALPNYDYIYLGDNARTPYGTRSFEMVYQYTLECVEKLFEKGCPLVILACNTASAKALRTIQQNDLPKKYPNKRVLGVIRPTTELLGNYTKTNKIGLLATKGTVTSNSYVLEMEKFFPEVKLYQQACPMWVPLIENNEHNTSGADFFIKKEVDNLMKQNEAIDTVLLACTHYPIIKNSIQKFMSNSVHVIAQGEIIAASLKDYLLRHSEINNLLTKNSIKEFYTTDTVEQFDKVAPLFYGKKINAKKL